MTTKDTESKTITWNGKVYTKGEIDKAYEWMLGSSKYWFSCKDKPKNPLTFLGFRIKHRDGNTYYLCCFKEVDSDNYYKAEFPYSDSGWNEELDGEWAWVSNTDPYPNTPINVRWELTRDMDAAYLVTNDPYEHVYYYECEKPESDIKQIGQWKLSYGDLQGEEFTCSHTTIKFYDDGNNIYRQIVGPSSNQEQWYISNGRQWPGRTDGSYNSSNYIIDGLIGLNNVTLVTGPLWSGKSHLIGQLCTCINNGTQFLGMDTAYGKALHIDCDTNDVTFGQLYGHIEDFYGPKIDPSYVASYGDSITKGLSVKNLLDGIEGCCMKNKDICLVAIDSVDLLGLDTFGKRRDFVLRLRDIAHNCRIAIVYSCTASTVENDAVDMAENCDSDGLYAEMSSAIIGIIPDKKDSETFYVNFDNKFDIHEIIRCRKNDGTHYCFDVEGKANTI